MVWLDQGDWNRAEEEAQEICSRSYAAEMYRFPALIALARLRIRRGDQDAETPFEAARGLAAAVAEPQRAVYIAMIVAEEAWQLNEPAAPETSPDEAKLAASRGLHDRAAAQFALGGGGCGAVALHAGRTGDGNGEFCEPVSRALRGPLGVSGSGLAQRSAVRTRRHWHLCGGDEAAQRQALEIFDSLGAAPAAARIRRQLRAGGSRAVPRGPIAGTRANAAGLTRRQVQVLGLVGEGLSNAEIARRLCISAKTAEHHVSAIMARLDVPTRQEAAAAARARGLLR